MHDLFSAATGSGVWIALAAFVALGALLALMLTVLRDERSRGEAAAQVARLAAAADRLSAGQAELAGRLQQAQSGFDARMDALARRVGDGLAQQGERTHETLRGLHERLALIDRTQQSIGQLSTEVVALQEILANKQARGAFGEVQLEALVASLLPADAYAFQVTLSNRCRADCLLRLPEPPGPLCVDAKFPLESFRALRAARDEAARTRAARSFARDLNQHVQDIASRYIIPGETGDSALMFLPSEAVYAELHDGFRSVVEESFRRKVWIVSPSTLWATLNTVRAVLRDVRLIQHAAVIRSELQAVTSEVVSLAERAVGLQRHFDQAHNDVRLLRSGAERLAIRAQRIDLGTLSGEGENAGGSAEVLGPAEPRGG